MKRSSALIAIARAGNAVFFLLTSAYCLLTYSPFAYQQFIRPHLVSGLTDFVVWHGALYWLTLIATAVTLVPYLRRPGVGSLAGAYLVGSAAVGIWVVQGNMLPQVENTDRSLALALASLVPPIWLAVLDHLALPRLAVRPLSSTRLLGSALVSALLVWVAYAASAPLRLEQAGDIVLSRGALALGIVSSLVAHVTVFVMGFLVVMTIAGLAGFAGGPGPAEYWLLVATSAVALTIATYRLVFMPIAFTGHEAWWTSALVAVLLALVWSSVGRLRLADAPSGERSSVDAWLAAVTSSGSRTLAVLGALALPFVAYALTSRAVVFDWNFMAQKLIALAVWLVAFAFVHAVMTNRAGADNLSSAGVPATVLALFCLNTAAVPRLPAWLHAVDWHPEFLLDGYAGTDPSFKLIRDAFTGDVIEGADFYAYLRANTTVRADVRPVDVDFVRPLGPAPGHPPHIFFFIIDSLRPDYLSPYNAKVAFTPALQAFAGDSVVFERTFSRYGGTGLSVPSIWAGAMVFHKEYVRPFASMNALEKLLDANRYQRFITKDHITDDLFKPSAATTDLDRDVPEMQHTFCGTMKELERDVSAVDPARAPIFAHTRPLDLHAANIHLARVPPGESYPGFSQAYASRVHHIDACFGEFVSFLKSARLYDDSIIIVMADHGDSLGDELRWGHAYNLFPEVLRIPLMVHLPRAMKGRLAADVSRVSFTIDVTPTLYALLGYDPQADGPLFGVPLFAPPDRDLAWRRRESYVVASSYGAVYGVLRHNGRKLYIADAINGREYAYDLTGSVLGTRVGISDADRELNRRLIREQVGALGAWYHYTPEP